MHCPVRSCYWCLLSVDLCQHTIGSHSNGLCSTSCAVVTRCNAILNNGFEYQYFYQQRNCHQKKGRRGLGTGGCPTWASFDVKCTRIHAAYSWHKCYQFVQHWISSLITCCYHLIVMLGTVFSDRREWCWPTWYSTIATWQLIRWWWYQTAPRKSQL